MVCCLLAVATLAAQFFVVWALTKFPWFSNYSTSGVINAQKMTILGYSFDSPVTKYMLVLSIVALLAIPRALAMPVTQLLQATDNQRILIFWGCVCAALDVTSTSCGSATRSATPATT